MELYVHAYYGIWPYSPDIARSLHVPVIEEAGAFNIVEVRQEGWWKGKAALREDYRGGLPQAGVRLGSKPQFFSSKKRCVRPCLL